MDVQDEDGAAILRRRARLVALALAGFTGCGTVAPGKEPPPRELLLAELGPAMQPVPRDPPEPAPEDLEPPWQPPAEADPAQVAHAEELKRRQLAPPPPPFPGVCLSMAVPQVCLWKKAWDDDEPVE